MDSNDIKQLIETLLKHMQVGVESIEADSVDGRERFSIKTPDSHMLIGTKGAHLFALNHLIRKMVLAKEPSKDSSFPGGKIERTFFVDVNGYQESATENIKNTAKVMGERARSFKTNVEFEPMSSYERMIIHSYFQDSHDLKTESVGEGEKRRVVIKYVEQRTE